MKENGELTKEDIIIESDVEIDDDNENQIIAYVETWFDVDKKFGLHTRDEETTWINLYARYDVEQDSLHLEYTIDRENGTESFMYEPTKAESEMFKEAIAEKLREYYDCTPEEFCNPKEGPFMN